MYICMGLIHSQVLYLIRVIYKWILVVIKRCDLGMEHEFKPYEKFVY